MYQLMNDTVKAFLIVLALLIIRKRLSWIWLLFFIFYRCFITYILFMLRKLNINKQMVREIDFFAAVSLTHTWLYTKIIIIKNCLIETA